MNPEEPSADTPPAQDSGLKRAGIRLLRGFLWLLVLLPLIVIATVSEPLSILLEIPLRLGAGWAFHLQHTLPQIIWSPGMIVSAVVAVLLGAFTLDFVARKLFFEETSPASGWSWRSTTGVTLGVAVLFGSAICGAGIVHQAGWLMRTEWVTYGFSGRLFGPDTERARQLVMLAKSLGNQAGGRLPERLEEMQYYVEEGDMRPLLVPKALNGDIPEPWIYLGSKLPFDAPDWMPVLVQPRPTRVRHQNMRVVFSFDGNGKAMNEEEYQTLLSKRRAYLQEKGLQP